MGLILDNATPTTVKTVDSYKITNIYIDLEGQSISVNYNEKSGEEILGNKESRITGQAFMDMVSALPDNTKSLYGNIKIALYAYILSELGVTGTVV